jgi:Zn finger protein HypA/HybF involved in hydrogenase expression
MTDELLSLDNLLQSNPAAENISGKGKKVSESAKTLESYHSLKLSKLRDDKLNIPQLQNELEEKKRKLQMIEKEFMSPTFITNTNDVLILTSRQALENEIRQLESQLEIIHNGTAEADYFLRVGDILFSYSDAQDRIASGEKPSERNAKKERMPANSVCSYFHNEKPEVVENVSIEIKTKKASDISNDIGFKRDKALESYLTALNPDSLQHENSIVSSLREDYGSCPVCETEMFLNETFLDCPGCGYRDCILVDSEKPSYKDPPREMSYYAYKKINHLNEWLAQFQAKETTEISSAVLDQIRTELRKERITDMGKLKPSKLKEVIKKLKLNRCYDHVAHILNRLNGISAPVLSREVEEKLRFMFKEIQFSFVKHCPKKRSNFLSYSFVLYKFCELLELDDYLPCFPLLKSREKLYMQDKIWQKICEDMGWEFIRTV